MLISDLQRLLSTAYAIHGDVQVLCGNHKIAGLAVIHTKGPSTVTILLKPPATRARR